MKKIAILGISAALAASSLVGCTEGNNVPGATVTGAAMGGLLGAALFHGPGAWVGVLGGALLGGVIGNQVGKHMDKQDERNMQHAIIYTPVEEESTWTNPDTEITYTVRPVREYHREHHYCREYQTTVIINGSRKKAFGKACRMPDGSWKVMN